jgi:D-beta-D-heptose 7-phosphate kinase / D-beta-D-heptose 1-phosphate adenosyltransferase
MVLELAAGDSNHPPLPAIGYTRHVSARGACFILSPIHTSSFPDFSRSRVLVAGDLMLDRYWSGDTRRISPEAPVPVVHVGRVEDRPGGAANVALNLAALGCRVTLTGVTGDDEAADILTARLEQQGILVRLHRRLDVPTITKLRVLSHHQQLIRLDFEEALTPLGDDPLPGLISQALDAADLLVLSDYAKGTLADPEQLIKTAHALGKAVLVDPKGVDFTRYCGATLLTPNRAELEAIVGICTNDAALVERGQRLRTDLRLAAMLITLGERGMLLLRSDAEALHLPTRAREVFDVTGAGDTVIATLAAALGAGVELSEACALANCAAGLAVGKLGTATVGARELERAYQGSEWHTLLDQDALIEAVENARAAGERIVMTNGCFDILHEGHVAYLQQAKRLGDRLVVAVNDDASVSRLKGPDRPINRVEQRMAVLAGLASVDWVCAFAEDTPEALICRVKPDLLVKGGDYRPEQIAGADCVYANGGEVRVLDLLPGRSTTRILGAIRGG